MFQWYAAGMPEQKAKPSKRPYAKWLAIAASMLLLVGIGFGYRYYQEQQELYAIYEGSYIIRDGIKNTDIRQILPELQATEQEVANALKQQNNNQEIPTI
jgi:predicted negative regulator of RcsB-dependent stress response